MDCRAGLIFLSLLIAQAACVPVRNGTKAGALNTTIQLVQGEIRTALDHLTAPGLLPNISCLSVNITELVGSELQPLTAHHLSSLRCYMLEMSKLTPELSHQLEKTSQYTQDMERLMSGGTARQDCSLPTFERDMHGYVYVRCLLQLLDQRFSKVTF